MKPVGFGLDQTGFIDQVLRIWSVSTLIHKDKLIVQGKSLVCLWEWLKISMREKGGLIFIETCHTRKVVRKTSSVVWDLIIGVELEGGWLTYSFVETCCFFFYFSTVTFFRQVAFSRLEYRRVYRDGNKTDTSNPGLIRFWFWEYYLKSKNKGIVTDAENKGIVW